MRVGMLENEDVWSARHKAVALYFDRMALMVPHTWDVARVREPRSAVPELQDRGLLITLVYPDQDLERAGDALVEAVRTWPGEIREVLGSVELRPNTGWRGCLWPGWYSESLSEALVEEGLAWKKWDEPEEGGPKLRTAKVIADIYRSALAEIVANRFGYSLAGVDHAPFPGASHWGAEIARNVLCAGSWTGDVRFHPSTAEAGLALVSVGSVLPENLDDLTVEQVCEFRAVHRGALTRFQRFIDDVVTDELATLIESPQHKHALQSAIEVEYERSVMPELVSLENALKQLGVKTVWTSVSLRTAAPPALAAAITQGLPDDAVARVITMTAGVAVGVGRLVYDARAEATTLKEQSPATYMLSLKKLGAGTIFDRLQAVGRGSSGRGTRPTPRIAR